MSPDKIKEFLKPLKLAKAGNKRQFSSGVLPQLQSIVEQFQRKAGHVALFAGASGTGKTYAATILEQGLGRPLYRVDLAGIVSKYIGETEKNLSELFAAAERQDIILFFDEADGLFGKRTDIKTANDRYAALDKDYLLKCIEAYSGLVILTTEQRAKLDNTFLHHVEWEVKFARPALKRPFSWRQLIPKRFW